MLKQTVQFEDHDGVNKTKVLYFNLTLDKVMENADIEEELNDIQRDFFEDGKIRELNLVEKSRMVKLVKRFMKLSYGVQKLVDGDIVFDDSDEVWEHFIKTAPYDTFLWNLFTDDDLLAEWIRGVFPREIREKLAEARNNDPDQLELPVAPSGVQADNVVQLPDGATASEYTRDQLLAMPQAEFDVIVGTDPGKMSKEHLQIAFQRKASGN